MCDCCLIKENKRLTDKLIEKELKIKDLETELKPLRELKKKKDLEDLFNNDFFE